MDYHISITVILVLLSLNEVTSNKMLKRFMLLETRVNTLEMRMNMETAQTAMGLAEVSDRVSNLNTTIIDIESAYGNGIWQGRTHSLTETEEIKRAIDDSMHDMAERLITAFKDEKVKIQKTLDDVDEKVSHGNSDKEAGLELQTVIAQNAELKTIVDNITATLRELEDEIFFEMDKRINEQYTQSTDKSMILYKSIKRQLAKVSDDTSGEISRLKVRLQQCETTQTRTAEENYNSLKQDLNKQIEALKSTISVKFQRLYECPEHWSRYDLFCYHFFDVTVDFHKAREVCADIGAHVVDLQDMTELKFVMRLAGTTANYWIGLTDIEKEGTWKWDRTSSVTSFLNWRPGQPDSWNGTNQDCVISGWQIPKDKWNDQGCSHKHAFVCKKSL